MKLFARLPHLLVRYRIHLFLLMTVLAVGSGMLIPHINVNNNMTQYLPDDSPMKQGMDVVAAYSPELDAQVHQLGESFGDASNMMPKELPKALTLGVCFSFVDLAGFPIAITAINLYYWHQRPRFPHSKERLFGL